MSETLLFWSNLTAESPLLELLVAPFTKIAAYQDLVVAA